MIFFIVSYSGSERDGIISLRKWNSGPGPSQQLGFQGELRFHCRGPEWGPFLAPTEFLTSEHNTLSGNSFAGSKACSYSRDLIRTIKGFLFLKACLSYISPGSPPLPFPSCRNFSGAFALPGMPFPLLIPHRAPNLGSRAAILQ